MKQTLEEAAKENILFNHRTVDRTLSGGNLAQFGITNFIQGAEWQAKQSPWISVKDKLPDNQNIVLVRDEYGGFCTAYLHGPKSGFITYGEEAYRKFGEITHWMPIPPLESNGNELERKEK